MILSGIRFHLKGQPLYLVGSVYGLSQYCYSFPFFPIPMPQFWDCFCSSSPRIPTIVFSSVSSPSLCLASGIAFADPPQGSGRGCPMPSLTPSLFSYQNEYFQVKISVFLSHFCTLVQIIVPKELSGHVVIPAVSLSHLDAEAISSSFSLPPSNSSGILKSFGGEVC